jgi:selenide,water dikinase
MREIMSGSVEELNRMGAAIVGGHSIEGPRTMIGFTVLGRQVVNPTTKGQLKVGDQLVMTKPLGTGILLAGWMQCKMPAECYRPLVRSMLQSNEIALELVQKFGIAALTDVTGFGFVGHLVEMMQASGVSVDLQRSAIPVLPGVQEIVEKGIQSTLAPDNRMLASRVAVQNADVESEELAPLFDPQTGGGLLLGVSKTKLDGVIHFLREQGCEGTTRVGEVVSQEDSQTLRFI